MKIDKDTIERVAQLSRITLTPEEEERLLSDFEEILSAFSMLDEAEADRDPAFHPIEVENFMREDEPELATSPDEIIDRMNIYQRFVRGPRMQ